MAPASVRCPRDCGPQPEKRQCPEMAGQRPSTERLEPKSPRTGGQRPGTNAGPVNQVGGNPTCSEQSAHRRLQHGDRPPCGGSSPTSASPCRAAADPPRPAQAPAYRPHARSALQTATSSPSVSVGSRGASHTPPGGATSRLDPAARVARAVGFLIPPSPAGAGRLRAGRRGHPRRSVCRHGHRDARRPRDFRDLRPLGGLHRRPPATRAS